MADKSKIEWTDASWTPVRARNLKTGKTGWHCEHATTGCELCYAEGFNKRLGTGLPFKPGHRQDVDIFLDEEMLLQPRRWKKPRNIFVCSMTDLFADFVTDEMIDQIFAVMALCPQHTFQVLTKRAARLLDYFDPRGPGAAKRISRIAPNALINLPLPNVWLGVSTERQQEANERIPHLLATPAAKRFVSVEPLLSPIFLSSLKIDGVTSPFDALQHGSTYTLGPGGRTYHSSGNPTLDWVIVGGESGPGYRPMAIEWANGLRVQCEAARVPFFFKQTAGKKQIPHELQIREFPR